MGHFFVSCPLGFEAELTHEIKDFWFEMIDLDGLPTRARAGLRRPHPPPDAAQYGCRLLRPTLPEIPIVARKLDSAACSRN